MSELSIHSASNFQQVPIMDQIQIRVAKKSLEATEKQGEAVIKLLEQAAEIAKSQGHPTRGIDLTA